MTESRRVSIIGAGDVGLATAIGLAIRGHCIELVEVRADRLDALRAGRLPIHEPGMDHAFALPEIRARIHPGPTLVHSSPNLVPMIPRAVQRSFPALVGGWTRGRVSSQPDR